jgi:type IV pilus assembly protein PilO
MAKPTTSTGKLAPFFQNIEKLTKPQRLGIYIGALVVILGLSVWFLIWPKFQEIERLGNQLAEVQQELAKAKQNASELIEWRNKMKQKETQYKTVMRALPEKEEIPSLLAGISQAGKDAGLEFLLFQPKPESPKDFYAEIPVDILVTGTYHQVAVFFDKVSNLPRIVNIRDIKMAPEGQQKDSDGNLRTACQAVTYKFIESAGQKKQGGHRTGQQGRASQ